VFFFYFFARIYEHAYTSERYKNDNRIWEFIKHLFFSATFCMHAIYLISLVFILQSLARSNSSSSSSSSSEEKKHFTKIKKKNSFFYYLFNLNMCDMSDDDKNSNRKTVLCLVYSTVSLRKSFDKTMTLRGKKRKIPRNRCVSQIPTWIIIFLFYSLSFK
jgi:hypothetical protein